LFIFSALEFWIPKRNNKYKRSKRWPVNLGISIINTLCLYFLLPLTALGTSIWAETNNIGVLKLIQLPSIITLCFCFLLLDLSIYFQHYLFHRWPFLWSLHAIHHSDEDLDTTSGIRFHPLEIIISMIFKCAIIVLIGIPVLAVIIFEITLNASALFTHTNIRLPHNIDRVLRNIFVTPDMHRIHHSINRQEQNSNYGFCLSVWDKLFKTYIIEPSSPHANLPLGLSKKQSTKFNKLGYLLFHPIKIYFKNKK
jgi:sterol desaturase/sphingolipid hydroxylase (fatty acid hydroxylase superfamily)